MTRLLVADDEDSIRELLSMGLRYEGFEVETAATGTEALDAVARFRPDAVVLDVMMPGLDGFAHSAEIGARAPATKILLMSGYAGNDAPLRAGTEPLLVKPFAPDTLLERVRGLIEG